MTRATLKEAWDAQADDWARFARTPGHDWSHEGFNLPAFLELLPPPGGATLDLGCGEGRVGAELVRRGYPVLGVDSSPRLVALAREHHDAVVADAAELPFADASFDLVLAYMSLMSMDDLEAAVAEAARVLEPGGRLCAAVVHPIAGAGRWAEPGRDSAFVIEGSYYDGPLKVYESDRNGIRVTFYDRPVPLERYARALERAGLLLERLLEPAPSDEAIASRPEAARLRRIPLALHMRALKR
jgi:SAM-dependent methyltransferase